MEFEPGHSIGAYRLLFPLKQSEICQVWAARGEGEKVSHSSVVLKVIKPAATSDPTLADLSSLETAAKAQHEGLVTVSDATTTDGVVLTASPLIEGPSLATLMHRLSKEGRPLSVAVMAYVATKVTESLAAVAPLVHGHLSPHNILIDAEGSVHLTDLGVPSTDVSTGPSGLVRGKMNYLAPEQINGTGATPQSDVFSLGAILYEGSSGQPLFGRDGASQTINAVLNQPAAPLTEVIQGYPSPLWLTIEKCLLKTPEERYANAAELHAALTKIHGDVPGYEFATDALAQFVTSLFPTDGFSSKTPPPAGLKSGGWPTVNESDPISGRTQAAPVRSTSQPPQPTSKPPGAQPTPAAAAQPSPATPTAATAAQANPATPAVGGGPTPPPRATSEASGEAFGTAGISTPSHAPPPLSIITSSHELLDPYSSNFGPLLEDPRTPKYAAGALGIVVLLFIVASLVAGDPDTELQALVDAGDIAAAEALFLENASDFDDPRTAYEALVAARTIRAPRDAPPDEPEKEAEKEADTTPGSEAEPAGSEDEPEAERTGLFDQLNDPPEPTPLDPVPRDPPDLPAVTGRGSKRAMKQARRATRDLEAGKLGAASNKFQRCLRAREVPMCHRQLGWIYSKQDNRRGAVQHYERYLELVPNASDAELIREHINRALSLE